MKTNEEVKKTTKPKVYYLANGVNTNVHKIPIVDLLKHLNTNSLTGLTHEDVKSRLKEHGPNKLTSSPNTFPLVKFLKKMFVDFAMLLWVSAILCFVAYLMQLKIEQQPPIDLKSLGMILLLLIVVTSIFSYLQERKSSVIMESISILVPEYATVKRNWELLFVPTEDLVIGDIVELKYGDRVPADLRILESRSLTMDNSALTGDIEPRAMSTNFSSDDPLETRNLVFFGTRVMEGTCTGIVVATGDNTFMGHMVQLVVEVAKVPSHISSELHHLIHSITIFVIILGFIFAIIALIFGCTLLNAVIFLICFIVANVPEGLLITITICLLLSSKRMRANNCLVRNLEAVATLGSISTICLDKTGTLTKNCMTVTHLWYDGQTATSDTRESFKGSRFNIAEPTFGALWLCAVLCNMAEFKAGQEHVPIAKRVVKGSASEAALLKFTETVSGGIAQVRRQYYKVIEIPFNKKNNFQVSVHELADEQAYYMVEMIGTPERIVECCNTIMLNGETERLTDSLRAEFEQVCIRLAGMGESIFAFADLMLPKSQYPKSYEFSIQPVNFPVSNLRFLGLISMLDPPRASVDEAIRKCRAAGVRVMMISGDHPTTAKAIAQRVGIITKPTVDDIAEKLGLPASKIPARSASAIVVHGAKLNEMTGTELEEIIQFHDEIVFVRTTPQQKLNIVVACQQLGDIVAVTGRGISDAPALKRANIGVAMGITSSNVSKQLADIILLDDNMASMVVGIEEGRLIFDNLKKSITYSLTSNMPEIIPFILFAIFNIPLALSVLAILCIDIGTDIMPAISLVYEHAESDIMLRKPHAPFEGHLISTKMIFMAYLQIGAIQAVASFVTFFAIMAEYGFLPARLFEIRHDWDSENIQDLQDSYGQEWTYYDRKELQYTAMTGFFVSIVVTQWCNLIICKTRSNSIFQQGMRNKALILALIFETIIALFVCYMPGISTVLRMQPIKFIWWTYAMPFGLLIIAYDETRRFFIRRSPGGWMQQETYY